MNSPTRVQVPEGHEVRLFGRTLEPFVGRTPGGLLLASTGCGGDDQLSEVSSLLDRLAAQVKPCAVRMNTGMVRLSELFAPGSTPDEQVESAAVLYLQKGSLAGWTDDALEQIAARLHELGRQTRLVVGLDPAHDVLRLLPLLTKLGIGVRMASGDGTIVAEVRRPDGTVVTGLVAPIGGHAPPAVSDSEATDVLVRSPRLNALVLDIVRQDSARSRAALEEYLKARRSPLALIAVKSPTGELAIQPRHWPGKQALVAYGDERSLHRAAHELGTQVGSYAIAAMPPPKLFAWAASIEAPVMLCAFEDRADGSSQAWHVPLEGPDLRRLAR